MICGFIQGTRIGLIKGDARRLDYGLNRGLSGSMGTYRVLGYIPSGEADATVSKKYSESQGGLSILLGFSV